MATIDVTDAHGATQAIQQPLPPGRVAAASSRPVVLSNEDNATIGALTETAPASDTASSGLNGRLQRIAQRITSLIALLPAALGRTAASGSLSVALSTEDAAKVPALGQAVMASSRPVAIASDQTSVPVGASAGSGGISSTARLLSAAGSTNATSVKGSAGRLYSVIGNNVATSKRYLKFYNKASSPTVGSDTPILTLSLPPAEGFAFDFPVGLYFSTGIAYALTTAAADADTGALTSGDVECLNLGYV